MIPFNSVTLAIVSPDPPTPKLTVNCPGLPLWVLPMAVIRYVTLGEPEATVSKGVMFAPKGRMG